MSRKIPTICPYCGGKVIFTDSAVLYGGKSYGMVYLCTNCNASVGVHKGTRKPLGTLANTALKSKRRETHAIFDGYWKGQGMKRSAAYQWLAQEMGNTAPTSARWIWNSASRSSRSFTPGPQRRKMPLNKNEG